MGATSSKVEQSLKIEQRTVATDARVEIREDSAETIEIEKRSSRRVIRERRIPKATEGEQVAAGWPHWLASVAGEALNGWIPRRADTFEKIDRIGQGTYSTVYKARDVLSGKIVALKKVRFDSLESESVKFMSREILVMRRLNHPNIIKLEGLVTSRMSCSLYFIMEYMEHDLTGITSLRGASFTEAQIKCYLQQLLTGLEHCHSRGVLHRDVKCSNLLIDNHGTLKIADFGLSTIFSYQRDLQFTSRVVTLWYRPPELLLGQTDYGVAVDLWSTGCVLAELYAKKPIMPGTTEVHQLHKIYKLCGSPSDDYWKKYKLPHGTIFKPSKPYRRCLSDVFHDIPVVALHLLETLLSLDPECRGTAASALQSEYFTTEPFASEPSSLPKYPPSKEADVELWLQEWEANRQVRAVKDQNSLHDWIGSRIMRAPRRLDADAGLGSPQHHSGMSRIGKGPPVGSKPSAEKFEEANLQVQNSIDRKRLFQAVPPQVKYDKTRENGVANRQKQFMASGVTSASYNVPSNDRTEMFGDFGTERGEGRRQASPAHSSQESVVSYDIDQLLDEHDRHIQEHAQRLRLEKRRAAKS